ncbi:MAG TPA: hypothetical protein VEC35_24335 [Noviherbaspirillum sp.]|nr:hypothetical protein [Noviherbaspirillum sp.]
MSRPLTTLLLSGILAAAALPASAQTECWVKRVEYADMRAPKFATYAKALLAAEKLIAKNQAFLDTPVPVRMRTTISAGEIGAGLWVYPFPEKTEYSKVWIKGKCEVYPASDTIGAMIGGAGVVFNSGLDERFFAGHGQGMPKYDGTVAGYPIYNGWVVMTRDGRLPWVPQTLADRIDREGAAREKKLAEWKADMARNRKPDQSALLSAYEMIKKTDPAGAEKMMEQIKESGEEHARLQAEVYPRILAQLEKSVASYRRHRASFSPEELAAPAVWTDTSGEGRKKVDAAARQLRTLPAERKQEIDALSHQNRQLTRQMQDATRAKDTKLAEQLRAEIAVLARKARAIKQQHEEQVAMQIADLNDEYALAHLKPGAKEQALAYKPDSAFLKPDPSRISLILVRFESKGERDGRGDWIKRAQENFDFAELAALLH